MDPVTHGLTGALIAETGFSEKLSRRASWVMTGCAMFPDLDIVYRMESLPSYIANHRALTHSFAGIALSGILIGILFGRLDEERRYGAWIGACCTAMFSHQILDLITSFGTVALYPISQTRFYLDWVFIIDLFLSSILIVFLVLAYRKKSEKRISIARTGVVTASIYILICATNNMLAIHQLESSAKKHQIVYNTAAAIPQPFLPVRWSGILDSGSHYYQVPFYSFGKPEPPFQVFTKTTGSFFEQKARDTELGILYYWFARYPVVSEKKEGRYHIVEFSDLRFYIRLHMFKVRKPFVLRFKMDDSGNIIESRFARS